MSIPNNSPGSKFISYGFRSAIARFDPIKNSWTKLGNLKVAREKLGVIQVDNEFIVVGGMRDGWFDLLPTESCKLNGQSMTCTTREPQLSKFDFYPELMLIPWNPVVQALV